MEFSVILSKITPTRKEADKIPEPIISRGTRRGLQSTEEFPREKQNPTKRTERPHREPRSKTSRPESEGIIFSGKRTREKRLPA